MASKTSFVTIEGTCKWARLFPDNMDTKFGEKFNVDMYLDKKNTQLLLESGFRGKQREDEDGVFYKLNRDNVSTLEGKGGPPKIVTPEGKPFTDKIGNGSLLQVLLEVYPSKYGTGSRIVSVVVLKHIPYERPEEDGLPPTY